MKSNKRSRHHNLSSSNTNNSNSKGLRAQDDYSDTVNLRGRQLSGHSPTATTFMGYNIGPNFTEKSRQRIQENWKTNEFNSDLNEVAPERPGIHKT